MLKSLFGVLGLAFAAFAFGGTASADFQMTCESQGNMYRFCSVDTQRGVRLDRQISKAPCVYGTTWGYYRSGIWVNFGCRARFIIMTGYDDNDGRPPQSNVDRIIDRRELADLVDDDRYERRNYPNGKADAVRACAAAAANYSDNRYAREIDIDEIKVQDSGNKKWFVRFHVNAEYKQKPRERHYAAECETKKGEVRSYYQR
ncbi:MAG: DUF3011 domain-containing protein [Alphaproteobacteria bacterium]|nr:DUF3011 domain-containing protein [Alphaproteobacteria bacterium]